MENLEISTVKTKPTSLAKFQKNIRQVYIFLRHGEDKIRVRSGKESVEVEVIQNGETLFIGSKYELYDILRKVKNNH